MWLWVLQYMIFCLPSTSALPWRGVKDGSPDAVLQMLQNFRFCNDGTRALLNDDTMQKCATSSMWDQQDRSHQQVKAAFIPSLTVDTASDNAIWVSLADMSETDQHNKEQKLLRCNGNSFTVLRQCKPWWLLPEHLTSSSVCQRSLLRWRMIAQDKWQEWYCVAP